MNTFDVTVRNLGPVENATFTASHLNMICGRNNSGKSILLHAVFSALCFLHDTLKIVPQIEHARTLLNTSEVIINLNDYIMPLNQSIASGLLEFDKVLLDVLNRTTGRTFDSGIQLRIHDSYATSMINDLVHTETFEPKKKVKIEISKGKGNSSLLVKLACETNEFPAENEVVEMLSTVLRKIFRRILPYPFLITAERSGAALYFADVLAARFSSDSSRSASEGKKNPRRYSYPHMREILALNDFRQNNMRPSAGASLGDGSFGALVMDGYVYSENGAFKYYQASSGVDIRLDEASSSVKSLAALDYFVRCYARPGALLMIDEPELNLHPARQRALLRYLARMSNTSGVGVAISTHSDYFVRELNTLLAFGAQLELLSTIMSEAGYAKEEALCAHNVACAVIDRGIVEQIKFSEGRECFFVRSFDETLDEINNVQESIRRQINETDAV